MLGEARGEKMAGEEKGRKGLKGKNKEPLVEREWKGSSKQIKGCYMLNYAIDIAKCTKYERRQRMLYFLLGHPVICLYVWIYAHGQCHLGHVR